MTATIVDTSGLLAALDASEPDHQACLAALRAGRPLIMSPLVLAEIDYLVGERLGTDAELTFLEDIQVGQYSLAMFTTDDHALALSVMKQYRDIDMGIADAGNVALAHRYNTTCLLTLDDHYRAITPLGGGFFTMLPADREAVVIDTDKKDG